MNKLLVLAVVGLMALTIVPASEAKPLPEPQCMQVYRDYDFGAVRVLSRNSCHAEVYVFGERVVGS